MRIHAESAVHCSTAAVDDDVQTVVIALDLDPCARREKHLENNQRNIELKNVEERNKED